MLRKLLQSVREYKRDSILAPLSISGEVVMECIIPMLMALMIDNGIIKGDMPYIFKMGGLLLACSFLSLFFGVLASKLASQASNGFAHNLREDLFSHIQSFSFSNIDKFSTGGLVTRLTTDISNVQMAYQMCLRMAIRSPFMLIFSLIGAIMIDGELSLIFAVFIPILAAGMLLIGKSAHSIFTTAFKRYDRLNGIVQENLRGIRAVKAFVREDYETDKFTRVSMDICERFTKAEKKLASINPLMQFCMYSCMILLSWFGAKAVIACGGDAATGLSTGELTSLFTYATQILGSLMMLSMIFVIIVISRASMERIYGVLCEESNIVSPENAVTEVKDGSIRFENVSLRYNEQSEKPVLNQVNLDIQSGMTVGILGGTGSSKSSLVQLIPRLYDASDGCVFVGGQDVRSYDLVALRDAVAFVLQKNELFSGTINENLRWGDENATQEEIIEACKIAQAHDFITSFPDGYETHIEQGGTNVSGGQKQRLCIARALLKKPKVLILDDSTSAVDTATDASIRKELRECMPGVTKLIIAQRVASVMDADRIIVLDGGEVVGFGTHDELLLSNDIYREVYEGQTKGSEQA